jgi:putative nucleotidyltransferase with HDIG domain
MRTGKNINTETEEINNKSIVMTGEDRRPTNSILITILPILSMIASILPGIMYQTSGVEIAKVAILTMILTTVATFYIRLNLDTILEKKLAKTVITISYLASIGLLLSVPKPYLYCFWMLGGLLVSMTIDNKLGLLFHFSLSFVMGISLSPQPEIMQPEIMIHILIIGVVMNLLSGALRSASTAIYAMIIVLSTNVTLSFVINNFIFNSKVNYNYLYSLFSILAVLVTAFILSLLYDLITGNSKHKQSQAEEPVISENLFSEQSVTASLIELSMQSLTMNQEETNSSFLSSIEEEAATNVDRIIGTSSSYDVLCSPTNELLMKLKQQSEALYTHALYIGDLSAKAAGLIGASEQLAMAGGLYHEIGKLNGKNYIEEGLIIAEDYAFPKELKAILREHNIKYDKPNSVEAAIVMLSDSVVSTIEYIEKSEEHKYTTGKVIDNIFQMRMDKGTFDGTNLSLKDFKLLKDFYQKEFNREANKTE